MFEGFKGLFQNINRHRKGDQEFEGILDGLEELRLDMDDKELIELKNTWLKKREKNYQKKETKQKENEKYWKGEHFESAKVEETDRSMVDNVIFEAVETFLPIASKKNPDPTVRTDNTKEGMDLSKKVQSMLVYQADIQHLKLKLKKVVRFWALYLLGVVKISWSVKENDIFTKAIRPQKLIFDPDGTINEDMQYDGEYLGEYKSEIASTLVRRFQKKADFIKNIVGGKMGSRIQYIEWWTNDILFWTLKEEVLGKVRNPHWNYNEEEIIYDEYGLDTGAKKILVGKNHFNNPKIPYVFLSIFNLGKHPFDDTSLIGQNLANQDVINKRQAQIDKNVDGMNGGWIVSGEKSGLTQEQATVAIEAARQGGGLLIAQGDPNEAVVETKASGLPGDVFNHLGDTRNELRNIFGTRGSTPQGTIDEQTVGGKMIVKEQDSSRIGGGISEYLEQFCDQVFNWWVQMMYVYYDEIHVSSIIGNDRAMQYSQLSNTDFNRKLLVSVKEGSMLPKDELFLASQAMELGGRNLIDPITLYDRLDFPNPQESAERLYVWQNAPQLLFPETARAAMLANKAKATEEAATQMTINEAAAAGRMAIKGEPKKSKKK